VINKKLKNPDVSITSGFFLSPPEKVEPQKSQKKKNKAQKLDALCALFLCGFVSSLGLLCIHKFKNGTQKAKILSCFCEIQT
jgi:hypothetical protein